MKTSSKNVNRQINHQQHQAIVHQSFKGPIPPPETLEKYNKIIPNAAERILKMAEENAAHIIEIEHKELEANLEIARKGIDVTRRGQNYAICFLILLFITVVISVLMGAYWVAGILGSISVVSVVTAFIAGGKIKRIIQPNSNSLIKSDLTQNY